MTAHPTEEYRFYAVIRSQPAELARLLKASEPVDLAAEALGEAKRVFCLGLGASLHTASVAAGLLGRAGVDARAWSSADFAQYPPAFTRDDAALVFLDADTAGRTRAAIEALGRKRPPIVLVTGAGGASEAGSLPMGTTVLRTGVDDGSTIATVAQTASILLAARIADAISGADVGDLAAIPEAVEAALRLEADIESLAHGWRSKRMLIALGAGLHEPTAHAAATLITSAGRLANGHSVEQFLSVPKGVFHDGDAFVAFASAGAGLGGTYEAVERARALGCEGAWVSAEAAPRETLHLALPDVGEALAPLVQIVPAQLLAGHLATVTGAGRAGRAGNL